MGRFSQAFDRIHASFKKLSTDEQAVADAKTDLDAAEAMIEAAVAEKVGDMIQEQLTAAVRQVQNTAPAGLATANDVESLTARVAALEGAKSATTAPPTPVPTPVSPPVITPPVVKTVDAGTNTIS